MVEPIPSFSGLWRFGAYASVPTIWRRRFVIDVRVPESFSAKTARRNRYGANVLALRHFAAELFWVLTKIWRQDVFYFNSNLEIW